MPDMYSENRDMRCAADVGRMAALGRFDSEFEVFGCAYLKDGKITYRASSQAEDIYTFIRQSVHENLYPTSAASLIHRSPVPAGMQEQIAAETKLALLLDLHLRYPRCFFEALEPLAQTPANDAALDILLEMADAIDGHFHDGELQLLAGLMQFACEAKSLTASGFVKLSSWLDKTRRQMEDDPVLERRFSRTLYGFCYEDDSGQRRQTFDAQAATIYERQSKLERAGLLTAPILQQTYWFDNFDELPALRRTYAQTLSQLEGDACFALMHRLRTLESVIDAQAYARASEQVQRTNSADAQADFRRYGRRWHLKRP